MNSISEVLQFYNLLARLYKNKHHMIPQPYMLFKEIYKKLCLTGKAEIWVVKILDQVVAGAVLLKGKETWEYSFGASDPKYANLYLSAQIVDLLIHRAIENGAIEFRMGSSSPSDTNLLFFKERFGCSHHPIFYYYWNKTPKEIDLNSSYAFPRRVFPFLPTWSVKIISRVCVPWLV